MAFSVPGLAGPEFKNKYESTTLSRDCGEGDVVTYDGPEKMWPPNHKMQDVSVTATDGTSTNTVEVGAFPDMTDTAGGDGGPNHDPDWTPGDLAGTGTGSASVDFQLRSERSGKGDGRTYTIDWEAVFDNGDKTCTSMDAGQTPFTVVVPHDMRGGRDW